MEVALFYAFSGVAVAGGVGVVLNVRNTLHAALSLLASLLALAGLFVMLNAEFLGVAQVLVHAGAVVVLLLVVLLLVNRRGTTMGAEAQPLTKLAGVIAVTLASVELALLLIGASRPWPRIGEGFGRVHEVGLALHADYALAVQVAAILLLAAIVGAVLITKQDPD